jgi:hypothetical protein
MVLDMLLYVESSFLQASEQASESTLKPKSNRFVTFPPLVSTQTHTLTNFVVPYLVEGMNLLLQANTHTHLTTTWKTYIHSAGMKMQGEMMQKCKFTKSQCEKNCA